MNPKVEEKKSNGDVVIDIDDDGDRSRNSESSNGAKACRICQESSEIYPLIKLGCDCKGDIALLHQACAAAWFSLKGNNVCEICGKTAKNIIKYISNNNNSANISSNNDNNMNNSNNNNANINSNNNAGETMSARRIQGYKFYLMCFIFAFTVLMWWVAMFIGPRLASFL